MVENDHSCIDKEKRIANFAVLSYQGPRYGVQGGGTDLELVAARIAWNCRDEKWWVHSIPHKRIHELRLANFYNTDDPNLHYVRNLRCFQESE